MLLQSRLYRRARDGRQIGLLRVAHCVAVEFEFQYRCGGADLYVGVESVSGGSRWGWWCLNR